MQHIKNFTRVAPTAVQLRKHRTSSGRIPAFLQSADGLDWYECQDDFADDTVKIQYDSGGIIRSFVAAPVPGRGDTYAVSMLFPVDCSVAEMAVTDFPTGCTIDGSWRFDGERVWQDETIVSDAIYQFNLGHRNRLLQMAAAHAFVADTDEQQVLRIYAQNLRALDLTQPNPEWPDIPAPLK